MFYGIVAGFSTGKARRGHVFLIHFPSSSASLDEIGQRLIIYITTGAIKGDSKRITADYRKIIREARMGYSVVLSKQSIISRQLIKIWQLGTANHRAELLIFKDYNDNMLKVRHQWGWRGSDARRWRRRQGRKSAFMS